MSLKSHLPIIRWLSACHISSILIRSILKIVMVENFNYSKHILITISVRLINMAVTMATH